MLINTYNTYRSFKGKGGRFVRRALEPQAHSSRTPIDQYQWINHAKKKKGPRG
ncbi:hypothetical protein M413DRAFT_439011, partial [Hebeloma cylindrosporum]